MQQRDTDYPRELKTASLKFATGDEARIERLLAENSNTPEIRFSWWTADGRLLPRPLGLPEEDLISLLREAVSKGVFTEDFLLAVTRIILSRLGE